MSGNRAPGTRLSRGCYRSCDQRGNRAETARILLVGVGSSHRVGPSPDEGHVAREAPGRTPVPRVGEQRTGPSW
jgi:hypothetical protein